MFFRENQNIGNLGSQTQVGEVAASQKNDLNPNNS